MVRKKKIYISYFCFIYFSGGINKINFQVLKVTDLNS